MVSGEPQERLVRAGYHQLFLAPLGSSPVYDGGGPGPLVALTENDTALIILTGCASGPVLLAIELTNAAVEASAAWEVQEEVDLIIDAALHLWSPLWTKLFEAVLEPSRPGRHRVRVSGRGRHTNPDLSVSEPTEHYLIQAWPSDTPAPRVILLDDGAGF